MLEELEPRILYAADLAAAAQGWTAVVQSVESVPTGVAAAGHELAFVDLASPDAAALLAGLTAQRESGRDIEIVTIAAGEDGVALIGRTLAQRQDIAALHLLGHGADGVVQLGASRLDAQTLLARADEIAAWSAGLTDGADLLIYGCDVAAQPDGRAFVNALAALTGADVAASDDATGSAALGGDWLLEVATGPVQAAPALDATAQAAFDGLLGGDIDVDVTKSKQQTTAALSRGSQQAVAMDATGAFVVVWTSKNQDGDGDGVYARRFAADGTPLTGEVLVNASTTGNQNQARVVSDSAGNFVVTWADDTQNTGNVYVRRFSSTGVALTGELRVPASAAGLQTNPVIAMNGTTGDFVVAWQGQGPGDTNGIWARRFAADGTALDAADRRVNATNDGAESDPAVAMDASGRFAVTWGVGGHTYFQRFDAAGVAQGGRTMVDNALGNNSGSAIAMDATGRFMVVYREENLFPGIWGRSYAADGSTLGSPFQVASGDATSPSVAAGTDGRFLVTYTKTGVDKLDIFERAYNANGSADGSAQAVNLYTTGLQQDASITARDRGNFVVVWSGESASQGVGVAARIFTSVPPVIISDGGGATAALTVPEGTLAVTTVTATDADLPVQTLRYTIVAGADAARFAIDSATGALHFTAALDREAPVDVGQDNVYEVTVQVSDGGYTDSQALSVTVSDVDEAPSAKPDTYTVARDGSLVVSAAAGLLANDSDPEGAALTVRSNALPTHGTLSMTPTLLGTAVNLSANAAIDTRPAWSADGTRIAFDSARDGNNEIYVMNANGSGLVRLTNHAADDSQAAWSPDGTRLAFMSSRDGNYDLWVMKADGTGAAVLAATATGTSGQPAWSPDGTKIAFTSNRSGGQYEIWVVNADGSNLIRLTNQTGDDDEPAWSPDGTKIAFVSQRNGNREIYVMNADGSGQTRLTSATGVDRTPDWSPDGRKLAFVSDRGGLAQLWMMDADGSHPVAVTTGSGALSFPDWSTDGRWMSYVDGGEIMRAAVRFDGSFLYTPDAGWSGTDSFTYTVADPGGLTASATVTLRVDGAPVITFGGGGSSAATTVPEGSTAVATLTATDPDGDAITWSIVGGADAARFAIGAGTGALSFVRAPDYAAPSDAGGNNVYDVQVQASDGLVADTQAIAVTVVDVIRAPVATHDSLATTDGSAVTADLRRNDASAEGGALQVLDLTMPAHGTAVIDAGGTVTYAPTPGYTGSDAFDYRIDDGRQGLAHYWRLDGNGVDAVGGASGTPINAPGTVAGRFGQALQFDGTDDHVAIPDLAYGNQFTLSFWFRLPDNAGTGYRYLYSHGVAAAQNSLNVFLIEDATVTGTGINDVLRTRLLDANDADNVSGLDVSAAGLADDRWHLYTLTTASGSGSRVYVDGVLRAAIASGGDTMNPTGNIELGANDSLSPARFLKGSLDGVALYARSLAADEVTALVSGGSAQASVGVTVAVAGLHAPTITSDGGGASAALALAAGTSSVTTVTATDVDLPTQALSYALVGGADAALFTIDVASGALRFLTAPDDAVPRDTGADNVYDLRVRATDTSGLFDEQDLTVAVTDAAGTITVTTATDLTDGDTRSVAALLADRGADGAISLREALIAANATAGVDRIGFAIPGGGVHTIALTAALPVVTSPLVIDGRSQPGYGGAPLIELDGTAAGATSSGLVLGAGSDGSLVRGLVINCFGESAIDVVGGANHTIVGNYLGVDANGLLARGNVKWGIDLFTAGAGIVIGGTGVGDGNVIGGNGSGGLAINGTFSTTVVGNRIGVGADGLADVGNGIGIVVINATTGTRIGGTVAGEGNAIAFSDNEGIWVTGGAQATIVGNRFAHNTGLAIHLDDDNVPLANDPLDVDVGANDHQNHPVLTLAEATPTALHVTGTMHTTANTAIRVELFASAAASILGYGEGERVIGAVQVTTDGSGNASFDLHLGAVAAPGEVITATATRSNAGFTAFGVTSEFSQARAVTMLGTAPQITNPGTGATAAVAVAENLIDVTSLAAADPDVGEVLTWTLAGGADAAKFQVDVATGALQFISAPDYELPLDAGADRVYDVRVRVTDSQGWFDEQDLAVTVTDIGGPITVTTTADVIDGDTRSVEALLAHPGADGVISLREAIDAANNTAGHDTILLPAGRYTITRTGAGDDSNAYGDFDIGDDLTIHGAGAALTTLSGASASAVMEIVAGSAAITDLSLVEGYTSGSGRGAALEVGAGASLSMQRVVVSDSRSVALPFVGGGHGGGLYNAGTMVLSDVEVRDNRADGAGGGILNTGSLSMERVTLAGNRATDGAGLYGAGTSQTLSNVTVSGNQASGLGGGLAFTTAASLLNVTVADNQASGGGGIQAAGNIAVTLRNVLMSNNGSGSVNAGGGIVSLGHNLSTDAVAAFTQPGDRVGALAALDPLADNGGFTRTHALRSNSVAIDQADGAAAPMVDQRGRARAGGADIGAFEFAGVANVAPVIVSMGGAATAAVAVDEGTALVGQVAATDEDLPAQPITYTITGGADAARFAIDGATGELRFAAVPDAEAPADADGDNVYDLVVGADDGRLADSQTLRITVRPINESAPVIVSDGGGASAAWNVSENTVAVTVVHATDADLPAVTVRYALAGGADATRFVIDAVSGELRFVVAPDFEQPDDAGADRVYDVVVQAGDGDFATTQALRVTVDDVDEWALSLPADIDAARNAVVESARPGTPVGLTVQAVDADGTAGTVTYRLLDDAGGRFAIDAVTGVLVLAAPLDYEAATGHAIVVAATQSASGETTSQRFDIAVDPVADEAPFFLPGTAVWTVPENTSFVGRLLATDPDLPPAPLAWSIVGGADAARFAIDVATGDLRFVAAPDYESPDDADGNRRYELVVQVGDGMQAQAQAVQVSVGNVDEAPRLVAVDLGTIDENTPRDIDAAELLALSSDPDGDLLAVRSLRLLSGQGTLADLGGGHWRFTPAAEWGGAVVVEATVDGGLQSGALAGTLDVVATDDPPVVTDHGLIVNAGAVTLVLHAVDPDTAPSQLVYTVAGTTGGHFVATAQPGVAIASFSQADVDAGLVRFVADGSGTLPNFSLAISDGVSTAPAVQAVVERVAIADTALPTDAPAPSGDAVTAAAAPAPAPAAAPAPAPVRRGEAATPPVPAADAGVDVDSVQASATDAGRSSGRGMSDPLPVGRVALAHGGVGDTGPATPWGAGDWRVPTHDDAATAPAPAERGEPLPARVRLALAQALDRLHDEQQATDDDETLAVGSTSVVTTGLSVGYVLWLARGGVLMASLMSSVPAWAAIDPLPVLAQLRRDEDGDDDDEVDPIEQLFARARRLVQGGAAPSSGPTPEPPVESSPIALQSAAEVPMKERS